MTKDEGYGKNQGLKRTSRSEVEDRSSSSSYYKCFQNYYHGHKYLNPNPRYITDVQASVNHWQLRDLLKVDSRGRLYYTKEDSVRVIDQEQMRSRKHAKLIYFPRCFWNDDSGAIATGGVATSSLISYTMELEHLGGSGGRGNGPMKGLFSFCNPDLDVKRTVRLGDMINNSVMLSRHSNSQYKSYVCNNDSNLYVVDINNNGKISLDDSINCETNVSLNNAVENPLNRKMLIVTGDSSSIYLTDPTSPGGRIKTIQTDHPSGFGISYHPNGNTFASTFQDGTCLLYDVRNLSHNRPLVEIKSTRQGRQSGAFRACKFSHSALNDLLVISEHVGRVHLIDIRNVNQENVDDHQVIVFPYSLEKFAEYKKQFMYDSNDQTKDSNMPNGHVDAYDNNDQINENNSIDLLKSSKSKPEEFKHQCVDVYDGASSKYHHSSSDLHFPTPLVYDYNYLTEVNPKLFRNYIYQPPSQPSHTQEAPRDVFPQWNSSYVEEGNGSPFNTSRLMGDSIDPVHPATDFNSVPIVNDVGVSSGVTTATSDTSDYTNYCQDFYQQIAHHVHGEMELAGIEWFNRSLYIACENGGIFSWDVNGMARRSSASCSFL